jgi:hypothetical protein
MKRKRRTKRRASDPAKPPSLKAQQQKVRKLQQLVDDLERGENFNVTRLVVIKSLCQDVKTAARFTLHLARLGQERWDWASERKYYSAAELKQHRKLTTEAFEQIEAYLQRRSESRERQLYELLSQAREVNNEYRNIPYGVVRSIKSWRVLMVETAIYCALADDVTVAGHWAYQAARDYAEQYNPHYGTGLIPESAPLVAHIAEFWQERYGDQPAD